MGLATELQVVGHPGLRSFPHRWSLSMCSPVGSPWAGIWEQQSHRELRCYRKMMRQLHKRSRTLPHPGAAVIAAAQSSSMHRRSIDLIGATCCSLQRRYSGFPPQHSCLKRLQSSLTARSAVGFCQQLTHPQVLKHATARNTKPIQGRSSPQTTTQLVTHNQEIH